MVLVDGLMADSLLQASSQQVSCMLCEWMLGAVHIRSRASNSTNHIGAALKIKIILEQLSKSKALQSVRNSRSTRMQLQLVYQQQTWLWSASQHQAHSETHLLWVRPYSWTYSWPYSETIYRDHIVEGWDQSQNGIDWQIWRPYSWKYKLKRGYRKIQYQGNSEAERPQTSLRIELRF